MRSPRTWQILPLLFVLILLPAHPTTQAGNAALSLSSPATATAQDSSVAYQLNPQHNGNIQGSKLKPPLKQLWTKDVGSAGYYPLVVGDIVYLGTYPLGVDGSDGKPHVLALNVHTGARVWGPVLAGPGIAYNDGRIFTYDTKGVAEALDAKTGEQLWKMPVGPAAEAFSYPPLAYNGTVFFAGDYGEYALRENDGTQLWGVDHHSSNMDAPFGMAIDNRGLYLSNTTVWRLDLGTGRINWTYSEGLSSLVHTPVIYQGRIYARLLPSRPGAIIDGANGQVVGTFPWGTIPVFYDDLGYYLDGTVLKAVNLTTGATTWTFEGSNGYDVSSPPIVVNNVLYFTIDTLYHEKANLMALDATTGRVEYQTTLPNSAQLYSRLERGMAEGSGVLIVPTETLVTAYSSETPDEKPTYFPETRQTISGPFQKFWETNGGLATFGYPISEPFHEISKTDGKDYLVQYFERNRFEYHPENAGTPYEVELGLLGSDQTAARRAAREAPFNRVPFPQVGLVRHFFNDHTLTPPMEGFWDENGGMPIFGSPISEPFMEKSTDDGNAYLVQYFERNRFEYHPDNPDPYKVLLGRLGVVALQQAGGQP